MVTSASEKPDVSIVPSSSAHVASAEAVLPFRGSCDVAHTTARRGSEKERYREARKVSSLLK